MRSTFRSVPRPIALPALAALSLAGLALPACAPEPLNTWRSAFETVGALAPEDDAAVFDGVPRRGVETTIRPGGAQRVRVYRDKGGKLCAERFIDSIHIATIARGIHHAEIHAVRATRRTCPPRTTGGLTEADFVFAGAWLVAVDPRDTEAGLGTADLTQDHVAALARGGTFGPKTLPWDAAVASAFRCEPRAGRVLVTSDLIGASWNLEFPIRNGPDTFKLVECVGCGDDPLEMAPVTGATVRLKKTQAEASDFAATLIDLTE